MGTGLLFALIGFFLVSGIIPSAEAQPNFKTIVVDTNVDNVSTSLALDSRGRPHIAYYDITYPGTTGIKYAWYDGRSWQYEVVDRTGYPGQYISLALDSNDRPHLA